MKTFESVNAILDFAIAREQEAYDFYTDLAGKMENKHISDMFNSIAQEEMGHKKKLQRIKEGTLLTPAPGKKIQDLKIGDYLVDMEPTGEMGYQDALILAMKKEKAAFKLYLDLSEQTGDENIRDLFLSLAQEEAKHKLRFELEYDENILTDF
ncbi:ferritin family protein [Candidatus Omnitrophota bacterium]